MSLVVVRDLAKSFGAQDVFAGVNVQIEPNERIALVGVNGAGKSTLLRIIAGLEPPTAGQVLKAGAVRIGYLPQQSPPANGLILFEDMLEAFADLRQRQAQLALLEQAMTSRPGDESLLAQYGQLQHEFELAGGYRYESEIRRVLAGVGFALEDFNTPLDFLSGGERTRALLAKLLLAKPDVLLLDEPTNHLDLQAIEWLENYLLERKGSLVVVAHDRYLLDRVVEKVWDLDFGVLESYKGNYSQYVAQKAERLQRRRAEYQAQQTLIAATEAFVRRYKAGQRAKEARGRLKKLGHLEQLERPQEQRVMRLNLQSKGRGGDLVLQTTDLSIGFRVKEGTWGNGASSAVEVCLFTAPPIVLRRRETAALIGPNGSGKTTFLRTILGQLPPLAGQVRLGESVRVGYLSQSLEGLDMERSPLDEILSVQDMSLSAARQFLSRFLFLGDDVFKPLVHMSGGEKSRVALAKLVLSRANFLILDEPTNHLDIPSREVLEETLLDFDGTILFVSHDRYLVDALATQVWVIQDQRLRIFEGGYTDYLSQKATEEQQQRPRRSSRAGLSRQERTETRRQRQTSRRREQEAHELERTIQELESRLKELAEQLNVSSQFHPEEIRRLGSEYSQLEMRLEEMLARWVEIAPVET